MLEEPRHRTIDRQNDVVRSHLQYKKTSKFQLCEVLGLASRHSKGKGKSRYVPEASLRNITTRWKGLRWAMPSKVFIAPLLQTQNNPKGSL